MQHDEMQRNHSKCVARVLFNCIDLMQKSVCECLVEFAAFQKMRPRCAFHMHTNLSSFIQPHKALASTLNCSKSVALTREVCLIFITGRIRTWGHPRRKNEYLSPPNLTTPFVELWQPQRPLQVRTEDSPWLPLMRQPHSWWSLSPMRPHCADWSSRWISPHAWHSWCANSKWSSSL